MTGRNFRIDRFSSRDYYQGALFARNRAGSDGTEVVFVIHRPQAEFRQASPPE
jgi:hypothetical protein